MGDRQAVCFGVAGLGGVGYAGAAGIRQTQRAGHFVKGFARSIVHGTAQHLVMGVVLYLDDVAVAARGHQAQKRRFQLRVGQVQSGNVSPQMVHRHQRLVRSVGQPLCKVDSHQHCADQPRGKGDGDRVYLVQGLARIGQGFGHRSTDELAVAAAGDLPARHRRKAPAPARWWQ